MVLFGFEIVVCATLFSVAGSLTAFVGNIVENNSNERTSTDHPANSTSSRTSDNAAIPQSNNQNDQNQAIRIAHNDLVTNGLSNNSIEHFPYAHFCEYADHDLYDVPHHHWVHDTLRAESMVRGYTNKRFTVNTTSVRDLSEGNAEQHNSFTLFKIHSTSLQTKHAKSTKSSCLFPSHLVSSANSVHKVDSADVGEKEKGNTVCIANINPAIFNECDVTTRKVDGCTKAAMSSEVIFLADNDTPRDLKVPANRKSDSEEGYTATVYNEAEQNDSRPDILSFI